MTLFDRVVDRLLAKPVDALVRQSLADYFAGKWEGEDPALFHAIIYGDQSKLHIDPTAVINNALFNLSSGEITISKYAFFGHNVCLYTGTHDFLKFGRERQITVPRTGRDIVVGEGAWLASNVTVVGPCTIGENAVVGVGSATRPRRPCAGPCGSTTPTSGCPPSNETTLHRMSPSGDGG